MKSDEESESEESDYYSDDEEPELPNIRTSTRKIRIPEENLEYCRTNLPSFIKRGGMSVGIIWKNQKHSVGKKI